MKVLVSSLQAKDLQNFLSDITNGVLLWSSVSRFHFRSKACMTLDLCFNLQKKSLDLYIGPACILMSLFTSLKVFMRVKVYLLTGDGHNGDHDAEVWFCCS